MNWDIVEGKWKQLKGEVQNQWGKLTDDEVDRIQGNREKFVGLVQERYGIAKDEAERQIDDFAKRQKELL
ncbi:CsbD family protein [Arenibacterium sp. LLYu02]|uniref:CsbD family protein n=1 Tax=Arenibacterium sp. LLYu02 TaxID=3404132 RepID=UPI003B20C81C